MQEHPLDRPIWAALSTRQKDLALGDDRARRLPAGYGVFGAAADRSNDCLAALSTLVVAHGETGLVEAEAPPAMPGVATESKGFILQMIAELLRPASSAFEVVELTDADGPEMLALATLTQPGPFAARTHQLGSFIGVRCDGQLAAMAGERLRPDGFTEISAVCTHPDHRGRGYAAGLSSVVAQRIVARGEIPFLHVYPHNAGAIAIYETLGFRVRRELHLTRLYP